MGAEPLPIPIEDLLAHSGWVRALARSLVGDAGLAEDLVQETWLAALKSPPGDRRNLRGWLGRVVSNAARQRGRKEAPREAIERSPGAPEDPGSPDELAAAVESQRELTEHVLALDDPYRATVILRYWHGLSSVQIARRDGVPAGTVRWRLKEALDRLRTRLDDTHGGDRSAWCVALAPLLRQESAVATGSAALPALVHGVLGMNLFLKLALFASVLVLSAVGLRLGGFFDAEPVALAPRGDSTELVAEAAPPAATPVETPPETPGRRTAAAPPPETELLAAVVPDAPVLARITLRALDEGGAPSAEAFAYVPTYGADGPQKVLGDPDGSIALEVDPHRMADTVEVIVGAPGRATRRLEGIATRGQVLELGDVVLSPGGDLAGRVVDERGRPVAGAKVAHDVARMPSGGIDRERRERTSYGFAWRAAESDAEGRFTLSGVPLGRFRAWATREGMLAAVSDPVEVRAGEVVGGLELVLEPLPRDDVIAGVVVDPLGEPVVRASVSFRYKSWLSSGSHSTTTDADGRFEELCEPAAKREVRVSAPNGEWREVVLKGVRPGTTDLVVRMEAPVSLRFAPVDEDGRALDDVSISLFESDGHRYVRSIETRADDGTWSLTTPATRFGATASAPGREVRELGPFDPDDLPERVDFTLAAVPVLRGRVHTVGMALPGVAIEVSEEATEYTEKNDYPVRVQSSPAARGTTDGNGGFELTLRRHARYYLRAELLGEGIVERGPFEYDPAHGLDLGEIELFPGGAIEGRVLAGPDESPAGRVVGISRGDGYARTVRVGADGRYRFENLIPGPWQVELREEELDPNGSSSMSDSMRPMAPLDSNCRVSSAATTRFDLSLIGDGAACTLEVTLQVDGAPAPGWTANLLEIEARLVASRVTPVTTDGRGRVRLAKPQPGSYRLNLEGGADAVLLAEVELVPGVTELALEVELATLDVEGLVSEFGERAPAGLFLWQGRDAWSATPLFTDDAGVVRGLRVPAGSGRIVRFDLSAAMGDPRDLPTLLELELPAGETTIARLP